MLTMLCISFHCYEYKARSPLLTHPAGQYVKLRTLDASFNSIERITGLESLVQLRELKLYHNKIVAIENLTEYVRGGVCVHAHWCCFLAVVPPVNETGLSLPAAFQSCRWQESPAGEPAASRQPHCMHIFGLPAAASVEGASTGPQRDWASGKPGPPGQPHLPGPVTQPHHGGQGATAVLDPVQESNTAMEFHAASDGHVRVCCAHGNRASDSFAACKPCCSTTTR